jgi:exodeoxyribonuclease X
MRRLRIGRHRDQTRGDLREEIVVGIEIGFGMVDQGQRQRQRRLVEHDGLLVDEAEPGEIVVHRRDMVAPRRVAISSRLQAGSSCRTVVREIALSGAAPLGKRIDSAGVPRGTGLLTSRPDLGLPPPPPHIPRMLPGTRVRVIDLETTGSRPPAHDVCEIGWQDVALQDDRTWDLDRERGARFVNPGRPIPPVTMAVHHIIDADVAGAPFWRDVAPSILRPDRGTVALAAHRASFEQRFCTPPLSGGARWICTWKCALRLWPDSPGFSNQVLRYWRMPTGLDRDIGLPVHRAMPDAYVTAHHLRDMLNQAAIEDLLAWSDEPGLLPRVPAGPERGRPWSDLDGETLARFANDRDEDVRFSARMESARRDGDDRATRPAPAQGSLI